MLDVYTKSEIELSNGRQFFVYHNMPETFGLNIDCALYNWLARTNEFNENSFCDYIKSKGFIALTEKQFKKLAVNKE
jgi:hypothetical protein